jgi:hypothetical protein
MSSNTIQDAQIFKERCEDSPGILLLCQGDWRPTPERLRLFEEQNYYVLTAANGFQDIVDWLPLPRCIGAMFAHPETVAKSRQLYPDKVIERFEGVGARFLRSVTQELPYGLHNAGMPFTATVPATLKTLDVVSVFSPVPLKRGHLLVESLITANVTAYLFAHSLGSNQQLLASFLDVVRHSGKQIEYFHYPFDPYALMRIDGRIIIDGRPIGANNSIVSAYLARCRLFVHTSTTEGMSNSVMEALMNDVPVLICDDIRGPLQNLSQQLPQCIYRAAPDVGTLVNSIQTLLEASRPQGSIRSTFRNVIDPFQINRNVVRGTQEWFARNGLPWKGHCLGLLGGVQSKIDIAKVGAEESYRGDKHIYPNPLEASQCTIFQRQIAEDLGRTDYASTLLAELQFINDLMAHKTSDPNNSQLTAEYAELDQILATLAEKAFLKQVLVIGAANAQPWNILPEYLERNINKPQLHCLEISKAAYEMQKQRFDNKSFIHCHYVSSVPLNVFPTESDIVRFYQQTPDKLKDYSLSTVLQWLRNNIAEMEASQIDVNGIQSILVLEKIDHFDMVIIDGREFTGYAELQQLIGSNLILLGCTRTFKNQQSLQLLMRDSNYKLLFSEPALGNGFAAFVKKQYLEQGGLSSAQSSGVINGIC